MSLADRLAALTVAVAHELKARVTAQHPGLAKAWVRFGAVHGHERGHDQRRLVLHAAHHVAGVQRLSRGCYLVHFAVALPDEHFVWTAQAKDASGQPLRLVDGALKSRRHLELVCTDADGFTTEARELNLVVYR